MWGRFTRSTSRIAFAILMVIAMRAVMVRGDDVWHRPLHYANYELDLTGVEFSASDRFDSRDSLVPPAAIDVNTASSPIGRSAAALPPRALPVVEDAMVRPATNLETWPVSPSESQVVPAVGYLPLESGSEAEPGTADPPTMDRTSHPRPPAGEPFRYREPASPEPLRLSALISRLVIGTAAVLATCVVSLGLARRWIPTAAKTGGTSNTMRVVASLSLPHRSYLQLVEVDDRKIIVGGNAAGVQTVVPLSEPFQDSWAAEVSEENEIEQNRHRSEPSEPSDRSDRPEQPELRDSAERATFPDDRPRRAAPSLAHLLGAMAKESFGG